MMGRHLLLDAIGAQALNLALNVELRLVDRIAQTLPRVPADHEAAGLGHERTHMADRTADHDVHTLHGYAATRGSIAFDDQQAALAGGTGGLAGVAFHPHFARHDVLGNAHAAVAVDHHA